MFYVAIGDNWCSVVPQSWINIDEKLCVWPSDGIKTSKAIKKSFSPQASWESVPYKYLLGPYNSFEEAKNKEKDAEFVSSDDTKINALQNKKNVLPLKRENKKPNKFYESFNDIESTDSIDSISEKQFQNIPTTLKKGFDNKPKTFKQKKTVQKIIPNPPSNYKIYNKNSDIDVREKDNIEKDSQRYIQRDKYSKTYSKKIRTPMNAILEERSLPVIKHKNNDSALQMQEYENQMHEYENQMQEYENQRDTETDIINENETSNKEENAQEGYLMSINRILDTVLVINRKLDSIPALNRKMDSILAFHDEQNPALIANGFLDLLPNFPLNSMEVFKKFCNDLNENEELRKQFQKKIRNIGGKSAENHLTNCLVTTLTNELAKHLTWEGQRQTEGIKNTAFANIITGTISNMYNSSNYYSIKNKFSEWLRRAGDRCRYQLKKLEHT